MLDIVFQVVLGILGLSLLICFGRLWLGPTLADRIVAMDLLAIVTVGVIVVSSASSGQPGGLDVAIMIALVGFLGTVAYAWYVQKEEGQ
jgi:multicomponent Na+:H+ antiporter subunit F